MYIIHRIQSLEQLMLLMRLKPKLNHFKKMLGKLRLLHCVLYVQYSIY